MNLHSLLCRRAAERRPLRVALIGAGKFGSMFLSQARRTPGLHVVAVADLDPARARERARTRRLAADRYRRASLRRRAAARHHVVDRRRALGDRVGADRDRHRRHRQSRRGHRHALACCDARQAHRDGERGSRRARGSAARAPRARSRRRLLARLRRSAGAHLRDGRLGARRRIRSGRRRQGHQVSAGVPRTRRRTTVWDHYGFTPEKVAARRLQRADVQLVSRRHEVRDRNGRGRERDRTRPCAGRLALPAVRRRRPCREVLKPRADGGVLDQRGQVEVVSSLERDGTPGAARLALGRLRHVRRARRRDTCGAASPSTGSRRTPSGNTPPCTSRST